MTEQVDELIKEIAVLHGIAVARDDPVMVLQTINRRLMQESAQAQQVQLDRYKEELEALAQRWSQDARDKSERILNLALAASKEAMAMQMQEAARISAACLRSELDAGLDRMAYQLRLARLIATLTVAAAGMMLLAALIVFWR